MNKNSALVLGAMVIGIISVPFTAMVNIAAGIVMMSLPLWMVYKAG